MDISNRYNPSRSIAHYVRRYPPIAMSILILLSIIEIHVARAQDASWLAIMDTAETLLHQGNYQEALPKSQEALRIAKETYGLNHPNYTASIVFLANLRSQLGYENAESLYQRALEIDQRVRGKDNPTVARDLDGIGQVYCSLDNFCLAESAFTRALQIQKKSNDTAGTIIGTVHIADLLRQEKKYKQSEQLFLSVLPEQVEILGDRHLHVGLTLVQLGKLYYDWGKYRIADSLLTLSSDILIEEYGVEHPIVASVVGNMAEVSEAKGNYETAVVLYQQAINSLTHALGPEHLSVAMLHHYLASTFLAMDKEHEAESHFREALRVYERHPNLTRSLARTALIDLILHYLMPSSPHEKVDTLFLRYSWAIDKNSFHKYAQPVTHEEATSSEEELLANVKHQHQLDRQFNDSAAESLAFVNLNRFENNDSIAPHFRFAMLVNIGKRREWDHAYDKAEPYFGRALVILVNMYGQHFSEVDWLRDKLRRCYFDEGHAHEINVLFDKRE